ncbi:WD40-repeat-containing domain protein [Dipodascopsis uninucleata]
MSSFILTNRQRDELNTSILQYLAASGFTAAFNSLKTDLNREYVDIDESAANYDGLLEKKWTSVIRLQKKLMDFESKVFSLQSELDSMPSYNRKIGDPSVWLPRISKYKLEGHREPVTSIAFHPVFSILASSSEDASIKIWDWELGELERTLRGHSKSVLDVDFGGRKRSEILLASCSSDLTIKIWDTTNEYKNIRTLKGHDHTVSCVRFMPGGEYLISGSRDNTIRIWEVKTGYGIRNIVGHTAWVKTLSLSTDGERIVSAGADQSIRISDATSGDTKVVISNGHDHVIECSAIAPPPSYEYIAKMAGSSIPPRLSSSFEYFATGSRDRTIKIWDSRGNLITILEGHDNWIRDLVFHPGGKYILSVGDDKTIRCWDLTQNGSCVRTIENAHDQFINSIKWAEPVDNIIKTNASGESTIDFKNIRCILATSSVDLDIKLWMA